MTPRRRRNYDDPPNANALPTLNLIIRNDVREIASVIERFDDFATRNGMSPEVRAVFDIAFDEMLSNIIYYAYPDADTHAIEIHVDFDSQQAIAVIDDDGVPFNPFAHPAQTCPPSALFLSGAENQKAAPVLGPMLSQNTHLRLALTGWILRLLLDIDTADRRYCWTVAVSIRPMSPSRKPADDCLA